MCILSSCGLSYGKTEQEIGAEKCIETMLPCFLSPENVDIYSVQYMERTEYVNAILQAGIGVGDSPYDVLDYLPQFDYYYKIYGTAQDKNGDEIEFLHFACYNVGEEVSTSNFLLDSEEEYTARKYLGIVCEQLELWHTIDLNSIII